MLPACVVCCNIVTLTLIDFNLHANSMDPDQTVPFWSSLIWVLLSRVV